MSIIFKLFNFFLVVTIVLFFIPSCENKNEDDKAAYFEFKINYLISADENLIINLLPEKMSCYYKNNYFLYHTEGWMGLTSLTQIIDMNDSSRIIMSKFMNKKYAHKQSLKDSLLKFEFFDFTLTDFKKDTIFCDHNCTCLTIYSTSANKNMELIYTTDFDIPNPNLYLPYNFIDGLLLKFSLCTMGIPIEMELIYHNEDTIFSDTLFQLPKSYQVVDKKEFEEIFNQFAPNYN